MEGVPWSKPTVLHAARKLAGGGSAYDDRLIRARMAQAFGRLIRRSEDRGSFVILSAAMPSRLLSAFPPGKPIRRLTLVEAFISVSGQSRAGHGRQAALGHQKLGYRTQRLCFCDFLVRVVGRALICTPVNNA